MNELCRQGPSCSARWWMTRLVWMLAANGAMAQVPSAALPAARGAASEPPLRIEVFANSAMPITNAVGATVYVLDALQLLEEQLSQGLPATEAEAVPVARERVRRLGATLQQRAANASQGMVLAARYGIDRIPAVVIDGRAIVYGITDVEQAVAAYRQRRQSTQEAAR
jgi:integrating conjugative element protein (TIGR03757 family)